MAKKKKKFDLFGDQSEEVALKMDSMMDCIFLLLMFFMAVSTIDTVKLSQEVVLPLADSARAEEDESDRFVVDIEWDESQSYAIFKTGTLTVGNPVDLSALIQIAQKRSNDKRFRVVIRADKRVPYKYTQEVMAAVADADVANMHFSTLETELPVHKPGG
ncbi:MAG: hypothetical protein GX811_06890 [Lentisphaerae bacterium]|jgi:biopolymer transport protein ExbD|nr:hypothetical protein [Lentisphaerota bacterium]